LEEEVQEPVDDTEERPGNDIVQDANDIIWGTYEVMPDV
jgi:hypothetical protein